MIREQLSVGTTLGLVRKLIAVLETIEKLPVYLYDSRCALHFSTSFQVPRLIWAFEYFFSCHIWAKYLGLKCKKKFSLLNRDSLTPQYGTYMGR